MPVPLFESTEVDLGVDKSRSQVPVSEYVGYLLERMPLLQHASSKAMTEDVRPLATAVDIGGANMTRDDFGKGAGIWQGMIRSTSGQKDFLVRAGRASVLQIIQQALPHLGRQRQQTVLAMFQGPEEYPILGPVNIFQAKGTDLPASHPVGIEHLTNRIITSPCIAAAVNTFKDFPRLLIGQSAWYRGQLVGAQCRHGAVQWPLHIALVQTEAEESPQSRLH